MNELDLVAGLNAQDDDGFGWSAVDADGPVHFSILPGSVAKNRHLLDRTVA